MWGWKIPFLKEVKMAYKAKACVLCCSDARVQETIRAYIKEQEGEDGLIDWLVLPGPELWFKGVPGSRFLTVLFTLIGFSVALYCVKLLHHLHGFSRVYVIGHEDCGAYGHEEEEDSSEEISHHAHDARLAKSVLERWNPYVDVRTPFVCWKKSGWEVR